MKRAPIILIILIIISTVLSAGMYIVSETDQVFLTQFGKPLGHPITEPGIHFKVPLLQKVHFFEKRFLEWDGHPNQVPTRDKRYISIDTYARWRIKDPLVFFQNVTDEVGAQTRLDDILDGATRSAIANHDLVEIVRSRQRTDLTEGKVAEEDELGTLPAFQFGRNAITRNILTNGAVQLDNWGIELLDIRFKRILYEQDVKKKIFERMISERQRIAEKYRSEGDGEAAKIMGEQQRDLKTIESDAFRQVQEIHGQADAEAATIYAAAYNQDPAAQEFYAFMKTLESYPESLGGKDWLLLSTKGDFFRYLRDAQLPEVLQEKK